MQKFTMKLTSSVLLGLGLSLSSAQQIEPVSNQNNTFNSTFTIPTGRLTHNISSTILENANVAIQFEKSNAAAGPAAKDPFYTVPAHAAGAAPGTLLKVDIDANTSHYTLPPNTALSRIMFVSKDLNNQPVPASAYVLWPFHPREVGDGWPVVAFSHGACGIFGECAPSHLRTLWYHFEVPFELALQGYVVVAPDYQGLGVEKDASGKPILNNFLANPAEANDLFYATEAAQKAFSQLSKKFITMGHSQGGGAAWAAAHRQAEQPVKGYLGTIPMSPVTHFSEQSPGVLQNASSNTAALVAHGLGKIYPDFELSAVLTPAGIQRLELLQSIQGCNAVVSELFPDIDDLVHPDWASSKYIVAYANLTQNANRPFAGPMLILQGTADPAVNEPITTAAVEKMCGMKPKKGSIEYVRFKDVGHTPVCYASRRIWLDWIQDRFAGVAQKQGCDKQIIKSAWSYNRYQYETDFFIEYAMENYELA
jgi:alpha-beta hydrolase superfamily lysophospholipase